MENNSPFDPFYSLARLFRSDLDRGSTEERVNRVTSVLGVVYTFPLALGGLVWLVLATDWTIFVRQWSMLLLLAALIITLNWLKFYLISDLGGGTGAYGNAVGSLEGVVKWSGILLFGPPVIWIDFSITIIQLLADRPNWHSRDSRWSLAQNLGLSVTVVSLLQMTSLTVYHALGGMIPIPGLSLHILLPGLAAVTLQLILEMLLLWSGYLGYFMWGMRKSLAPHLLGSLPVLLFMGQIIPYLANLFAVPLAGIFSEHGLFLYLVFISVFLLAGFLARQMSRASENSRTQSVQLEKLATLGRAILKAPPGASTLPEILSEHVPAMFTYTRLGIWVGAQPLLTLPVGWLPKDQEPIQSWFSNQDTTHVFTAGDRVPWPDSDHHRPIIFAPILNVETGQRLGGIYVELAELGQNWDRQALQRLLPSLQGLAAQVASALHQAKVYKETLAYQKTQQELAIARQIQTSFLPRSLPQIPGWQISASLEPAYEMAGDFYDFIALPDDHLGIIIADVADKGIGPALYMALSRTLIRTFAVQNLDRPEKVLQFANERILQDTDYGSFVTTFYGVLDPRTGELTYANAGHNPPWVFDLDKPDPNLLLKTGMALGVDESVRWTKASVQLAPGNTVFFYTDGATDAQNEKGEMFDEKRLLEAVQANRSRPVAELHHAIIAEIRAFACNAPQFDDITLIVVRREK